MTMRKVLLETMGDSSAWSQVVTTFKYFYECFYENGEYDRVFEMGHDKGNSALENILKETVDYLLSLEQPMPSSNICVCYRHFITDWIYIDDEDNIDEGYFDDVLIFRTDDIMSMQPINELDVYSTLSWCNSVCGDGRHIVFSQDDEQIRKALSKIDLLPKPFYFSKNELANVMNAWIVEDNKTVHVLGLLLMDCARVLFQADGRTAWLPEDFHGGIPTEYYENTAENREKIESDEYRRKKILIDYINLYRELIAKKEKIVPLMGFF